MLKPYFGCCLDKISHRWLTQDTRTNGRVNEHLILIFTLCVGQASIGWRWAWFSVGQWLSNSEHLRWWLCASAPQFHTYTDIIKINKNKNQFMCCFTFINIYSKEKNNCFCTDCTFHRNFYSWIVNVFLFTHILCL